jgi:hypothetical protein
MSEFKPLIKGWVQKAMTHLAEADMNSRTMVAWKRFVVHEED